MKTLVRGDGDGAMGCVAIAKTFPFEVNGVNLPSAKAKIKVIADNGVKNLFVQFFKRGLIKFHRGKDAVCVQPCLKSRIDAVKIKQFDFLVGIKDVCVVDDIKAVRLMQGGGQLCQKTVGTDAD